MTKIRKNWIRINLTILLVMVAVAFAHSVDAAKYRPAPPDKAIPKQYIVVLKSDYVQSEIQLHSGRTMSINSREAGPYKATIVSEFVQEMVKTHKGKVLRQYHSALPGYTTRMKRRAMRRMLKDKRIAFVEQDQIATISATENNATWGLDRIDQKSLPLDNQYTYNYDGTNVDAYIIDTGIRSTHNDFGGRVLSGFSAIDDGMGTEDCNGHGTHVAGTIGGSTWGVAKNVNLIPVRVLRCSGSGSYSDIIAGIDWVKQHASGPSVANMSLGGGDSAAIDNAVKSAIASGITFVVAAGNDNADACQGSPNKVPEALTIGATESNDTRSSFSNWGSCIDMFAPGSGITSAGISSDSSTAIKSGTSMAAPHVAGVVALYLDQNPSASPSNVESALENAAATNRISNVNGSPNLLVQTDISGGGGGGDEYCNSSAKDYSYEWIAGVQVGSLNNTSGAAGYTDFTSKSVNLSPNELASVKLTPGFGGGSYSEAWKVWIDYNKDGDFEDTGEVVFSDSGTSAVIGNFTVPGSASGTTRMRVSMAYKNAPNSCDNFQYGEVEDYTVNFAGNGGGIDYCETTSTNNNYEWIAIVQIGSAKNASGSAGYSDFTSKTFNLTRNGSVKVRLSPGFTGKAYTEAWKVWIDYNKDGDFEDSGEVVFSGSGSSTVSGYINVPGSSSGPTRMRVSMGYKNAPNYCGSFKYGEAEDYTVNFK